jgi:lipoprotein-anchoring transpeptidase ErfK/SrfK
MNKLTLFVGLAATSIIALGLISFDLSRGNLSATASAPMQEVAAITTDNAPPAVPGVYDGVTMTYDPFKPTDGPYPTLTTGEKIWIDVSIDQQLVYIFRGSKRLYTMATSSGLESIPGDASPLGVYHIQAKRGTWFYEPQYREGAEFWVSWLGNGVYLFHSVPMDKNRKVLAANAAQLLHENSHGCFHLTIPDARWFYENVPYGTTVIVERSPVALSEDKIYAPSPDQQRAIAATSPGSSAEAMSITIVNQTS